MTTSRTDALFIARQVRSGEVSAVEVMLEHLARVAELDPALGAFQIVRTERALAEAAEVDARPDRATLPLAGVPVAIKDNIDVAGEPTRHGSAATPPEPVSADDELVRRLRAAGCVVIGKTRMPELAAWAFTSSAAYGITRNPWNRQLDPGGSTGGGAVAVATGMAALALGTDGGGSLRVPAAACGVVGFKPASGDVPLPGGAAEHWYGLTAAGPLARSVADAAAMLAALGGPDPKITKPRKLRVAVSLKSPSPVGRPDAHVRGSVEYAQQTLEMLGHRVERADPPYSPLLISRWTRLWHAGVALDARDLPLALLEPRTRTMVSKGRRVQLLGGPRRTAANRWRARALAWLEQYDVLITPVVAAAPPIAGSLDGRGYLSTLRVAAAGVPYTQAWNLAGLPAMTVPIGIGEDHRPQAVQMIAKSGDEAVLFGLAQQIERFRPHEDESG
jgi:amidase